MDKLIRRLTDKVTGQPIVNAIVKARPVGDPSGVSDKNMPETPPGSGIYATADQIDHDTYKIVVNGSDSLDEYTVEAGRAKVRSGVGAFLYPLIDRIIDAKLYLSGMIGDSSATASSGDFRTAILAATASSALKRELVLTQDATIDSDAVVAQDLLIDLNGFSLTLNADITSISNRITVRNGKLVVTGTGPKILSNVWTSFINVEFFGLHVEIQSSLISYVGCTGRATLPGAENAGSIPVVAGGKHSFATASDLKLTTISTKTGSGRLTALQSWIDSWLSDVARMDILAWLLASKTKLDQWVASSSAMRTAFAAGDILIDSVKNAKNLGTDANGKVIPITNAEHDNLTINNNLVVNDMYVGYIVRPAAVALNGSFVNGTIGYVSVDNLSGIPTVTILDPPYYDDGADGPHSYEMTITARSTAFQVILNAKFSSGAGAVNTNFTWVTGGAGHGMAIKLVWIRAYGYGQWHILQKGL